MPYRIKEASRVGINGMSGNLSRSYGRWCQLAYFGVMDRKEPQML